ncbi:MULTISPECIES: hypothetical protein [Sphingobium]|nr:hypothetical protein [Sphingobium sp. MI1205]
MDYQGPGEEDREPILNAYVHLADGWRIKEIRLTRLRVDAG